jgi:hypothetical protein
MSYPKQTDFFQFLAARSITTDNRLPVLNTHWHNDKLVVLVIFLSNQA